MRLALCNTWATFWTEWRASCNKWASHAQSSLRTASDHEKWLCSCLLIPLSLLDAIPP